VGNIMRLSEWGLRRDAERLAEPVDRSQWPMTAQTVGASYNSLTNQITFPAGILQRPLFDPSYDAAVNYGRIGSAIGHELGHGFDDQGRRFDGQGKLRDWWSPTAAARFDDLAKRLGQQFAGYEPLPGFKVNAEITMGENIGDLGGLEMAYAAYRRHVAKHGEPPVVGGLTGDQRFFISFAQTWASHMSDTLLRQVVLTDEHSPPEYRVNGIVRNMDAWYRAFDIKPGHKLYLPPEQRVRIWEARAKAGGRAFALVRGAPGAKLPATGLREPPFNVSHRRTCAESDRRHQLLAAAARAVEAGAHAGSEGAIGGAGGEHCGRLGADCGRGHHGDGAGRRRPRRDPARAAIRAGPCRQHPRLCARRLVEQRHRLPGAGQLCGAMGQWRCQGAAAHGRGADAACRI
jgi:hypothetical protein